MTEFYVERWALWRPAVSGELAPIPEVPDMLRRRASATARAGLRAAFDCFPESDPVATVFCSRHGEIQRTVELLGQLCEGDTLSPTSFSLSVHGTAATLFSISRKDESPVSVISAGADSLAMGLLEAAGRLHDGDEQVLLVAHDELLPPPLQSGAEPGDGSCALALLLRKEGVRRFSMRLQPELGGGNDLLSAPLALPLVDFLASEETEVRFKSHKRTWIFQRHA